MEILATFMSDGRFLPDRRFVEVCKQFRPGDRVILEILNQQNAAKRAMFHATLREVYASLPDALAERWISYDHFRAWLTIKCGFATESQEVCETRAEAERWAKRVQGREPYAIVKQDGNVVTVWTAKSTKAQSMDGKEFSALVDAVLGKAADLIGVEPKALRDLHRVHRDKPDKHLDNSPSARAYALEPQANDTLPAVPAEAGSVHLRSDPAAFSRGPK